VAIERARRIVSTVNASAKLIDRTVPATVGLRAEIPESHPSAAILGTERHGTGTIFDPSGLVLTVNYIVLGADSIDVTLVTGETVKARSVAQDFASGLAVLALEHGGPLPTVTLCSSQKLCVGQEVFVIASIGAEKRRGNNGCITSLDPFDAYWEYRLERAIHTTAVNPGVGGAPLFDALGRVVGIISLDLGQIGRFTLAVPCEHFLDNREELLRFGKRTSVSLRAWVGFYCYASNDAVVVAGVFPGAPAENAGLKAGDVVVSVNGRSVGSRAELYTSLWRHTAGDQLTFEVFRERQLMSIPVESGSIEEFFA
jgi:S1-C subfamily serine protease